MKKFFLSISLLTVTVLLAQKVYPNRAVNFSAVKFTGNPSLPQINTYRNVSIPSFFERRESTGRAKNFDMTVVPTGSFCTGFPFYDTFGCNTIEGKAGIIPAPSTLIFSTEHKPGLLCSINFLKSDAPEVIIVDKGSNISTIKSAASSK